ncbi:hypothetical protein [Streptacidiphilus melanogenes]|nr:hypothetical protein [Streptacidiphilus melanogenes]
MTYLLAPGMGPLGSGGCIDCGRDADTGPSATEGDQVGIDRAE